MNGDNEHRHTERAEWIVQRLLGTGLAQEVDIQPCSEGDIRALESRYGVQLPAAYKHFLRRLGRGAGPLLEDGNGRVFATWDTALELTATFHEGFSDRVSIPRGWFCFAMLNKGDLFLFLPADGSSDDPPVYYWSEDWSEEGKLEQGYPSFWDWLEEEVNYQETRQRQP